MEANAAGLSAGEHERTADGRWSALGQNFLADPNLLDAIVRDAELEPGDVVLEVGGGGGVLTGGWRRAAAHLHVIELDRGLEPALAAVAARPNVDLHWGDAMGFDLGALRPAPTAVVANLPYAVATPVILRTIEELPSVGRWTVMVQREIADRLGGARQPDLRVAAALAQLACEVKIVRPVDPAVFRPRPRVASAILGMRRIGPAADQQRASWCATPSRTGASRSQGRWSCRPGPLAAVRAALAELGLPEDARAEALAPQEFAALAAKLAWGTDMPAP